MPDKCVHHWIIDSEGIGRCKKPGCNAVKDFRSLQRKKDRFSEYLRAKRKPV